MTATDTSAAPNDPQDGNETCTYTVVIPEVDSCTFTSPNLLTNGDSYTFTVTGTNGDGTGAASAPSNGVTPSNTPDAPTSVVATGGNKTATVTWTDGSSEGSATTSYTVTATDSTTPANGGQTCTYTVVSPEVDSCTFTSPNLLTNGDSYTFTVTATNGDGTGAASAPSNGVTPSTVPDAPTHVTATAGIETATVNWTPGFNEGSKVTSYTVTATDSTTPANGGQTCTDVVANPEVDSCTFTSPNLLTSGDTYTFTVTATNGDGTGAASGPSNSVTPPTSAISVGVSASPTTYSSAGTVITYTFAVSNSGSTALHNVGVTDSVVGAASCPQTTLAIGASEHCTGSYTTVQADVVNGSITDTATAHALDPADATVTSAPASTTVSASAGLHITTTSLTPGQKNVAYNMKLAATGGTAPYSWSLAASSGALPPGLTLGGAGKISGTPTKKGTYSLTFKVTDAASPKDKATATLTLVIDPAA